MLINYKFIYIMVTFKITFLSVTLRRRVSYAQYVGLRNDYMSLESFIAACAVIASQPDEFPLVQVTVRDISDSSEIKYSSSDILFRAPLVSHL